MQKNMTSLWVPALCVDMRRIYHCWLEYWPEKMPQKFLSTLGYLFIYIVFLEMKLAFKCLDTVHCTPFKQMKIKIKIVFHITLVNNYSWKNELTRQNPSQPGSRSRGKSLASCFQPYSMFQSSPTIVFNLSTRPVNWIPPTWLLFVAIMLQF